MNDTLELEGESTDAKIFTTEMDDNCVEQIRGMIDDEAFTQPVRVMPDTHAGKGSVIGFTMPLGNRVCPNTVGVDIGCGMFAACFGDLNLDTENDVALKQIDQAIRDRIPMGFDVFDRNDYHMAEDFPWKMCQHKLKQFNENSDMPDIEADYGIEYFKDLLERLSYDAGRAINSLGTLGGGNHFIELAKSQRDGKVWCIIHSGSRGPGAAIAEYWQKRATQLRKLDWVEEEIERAQEEMPEGHDVLDYVKFDARDTSEEVLEWMNGAKGESFKKEDKIREDFEGEEIQRIHTLLRELMPDQRTENEALDYLEGEEAAGYIRDMIFAQTYASQSRVEMAGQVAKVLGQEVWNTAIESVHNYIDFEDQTIRKGACRAHEDELIVVPFNMRDGTLICKGKGNEDWNRSAPHGAGRVMSRTRAYDELDVEDYKEQMSDVYSSSVNKHTLDEAPGAYKRAEMIEEAIKPTAEIVNRLKPFLNIKAED